MPFWRRLYSRLGITYVFRDFLVNRSAYKDKCKQQKCREYHPLYFFSYNFFCETLK